MNYDCARPGRASMALPPDRRQTKLLDGVRAAIRMRHDRLRTEEAYVAWFKRFIFFHGVRHLAEMGAVEINPFLSDLAVNGRVSASTQNQAISTSLFWYQKVLETPFEQLQGVIRANLCAGLQTLPVTVFC